MQKVFQMEKKLPGDIFFILFLPFETLVDLGAGDLVPEPLEPGDLAGPVGDLLEDGEAGQARLPLPSTHFPADGLQPDW
jgi:hypothetical protein